jgi:peptidoglycan hydrolase CwlO-like protein
MNTVKTIEKAGRQVWLAGLGVCLLGRDLAAKKLDDVFEGTNTLVNDMMGKGAEIESELKSVIDNKFLSEEKKAKVTELREKLGLNKETQEDKLARLSAKVDALTDVVTKLADAKAEQAVVAPAEEKPVAKKAPARKPRSTAAEAKAPARKTTARRAPAKKQGPESPQS